MRSLLLSIGIGQSNQPQLGLGECRVHYGILELEIQDLLLHFENIFETMTNDSRL